MVAAYRRELAVHVGWLGLRVGGRLPLSVHYELLQWPSHDVSTVNIVISIIITGIIII